MSESVPPPFSPESPRPRGTPVPYAQEPVYYGAPPPPEGGGTWIGEITPRRLLRVARQQWLMITLAGAFAVGIGVYRQRLQPQFYRASASIEMSVRRPRIMGNREAMIEDGASSWRASEIFNTRIERFRSPAMRAIAFEHLRDETPELAQAGPAAMPFASFSLVRESNLVRIEARTLDPAWAVAGVNAYARAAETIMIRENREASDQAVAWLQEQVDNQRHVIHRAEADLLEFRALTQIDQVAADVEIARRSLQTAAASLADVQTRQVLNRELLTALDAADLTPEGAERIPRDTPFAEAISQAMRRHEAARNEMDALRLRYTEQHPDFVVAREAVDFARGHIAAAFRQARKTVQADARLLEQQAAVLEQRVADLGARSSALEIELAQSQAAVSAIERERDAADLSYRGILRRIEEARLSADENTATVKIVQLAEPGGAQVTAGGRRRTLAVALLLGLALGGGLALLKDSLADLLQHDEDIEQQFGIKALSVVPHQGRRAERRDLARMVHEHKHSHFAEAFAGLRGLLDSTPYRDKTKVLLVSSTVPEVGKTICATNLAISFAQCGERTLLVDFDLRRPQLRRVFNIPKTQENLLQVLAARAPERFEKLPFQTDIPNVSVVCSRPGGDTLSAAEVLGHPFSKTFVDWAREHYDRVVLDSPPFGVVNDAAVLGQLADGAIMIVRPGKTRKHSARNGMRHLDEVGVPILGVLVNALDVKKAATFSYYNYYYSHHVYGYGQYYQAAGPDANET